MTVRVRSLTSSRRVHGVGGVSKAKYTLPMSAFVIYRLEPIHMVELYFNAWNWLAGGNETESVRQGYSERNCRYRRLAAIQRGRIGRQYGDLQMYQGKVGSKRPRWPERCTKLVHLH